MDLGSTDQPWTSDLGTNMCETFLRNECLVTICLDIEKAYDSIPRIKNIKALIKIRLNGNTLPLIKNFLSNRSIQVKTNGTLFNPTIIHNGVPQGSVISVRLFVTVINDILINIKLPILHKSINDLLIWLKNLDLNSLPKKQNTLCFLVNVTD